MNVYKPFKLLSMSDQKYVNIFLKSIPSNTPSIPTDDPNHVACTILYL